VAHEVFIGIAEDVVVVGAVLREVQRRIFEDGDQVSEPVYHLLAAAKLRCVIEIRKVGELIGTRQRGDDLLINLIANVRLALESDHVLEARSLGDGDWRVGNARVLVADVFDEQQNENVVLVLAGVHAATQFVAGLPEGGVEFGFFDSHGKRPLFWFFWNESARSSTGWRGLLPG